MLVSPQYGVRQARRWLDLARYADSTGFEGDQTRGVGTRFVCDTKIGPFRLTDRMEITEWLPREAMGVRHTGIVEGTGRFTLHRAVGGGTLFAWEEDLMFPWWLAGGIGAASGRPALRRVWRRNLAQLKELVERAT